MFPQTAKGLRGVLFSPFVHKDMTYLLNNSYPILFLGGLLFSMYRKIALQIFLLLFCISGFLALDNWSPSFHIGASGMIYALGGFLCFSGIIK